jgi:hypothetical protein
MQTQHANDAREGTRKKHLVPEGGNEALCGRSIPEEKIHRGALSPRLAGHYTSGICRGCCEAYDRDKHYEEHRHKEKYLR